MDINISNLEKLSQSLDEINNTLNDITITCNELSQKLEEISSLSLSDFLGDMSNIITITKDWETFLILLLEIPGAMALATLAIEGLGTAMSFLEIHPIMMTISLITTGLVVIGGLLTAFSYQEDKATVKTREFYEAQQKKREEIDKTTTSLRENAEATKKTVDSINTDYSFTLSQIDQLVQLTGADGYVGNVNQAKYLVEQINKVLPNSVELVNGNKVVWHDLNGEVTTNIDKIKESIEALKQRAIVEAYQKDYIEAIKNESSVTAEKIKAENALTEARRRYLELQEKGFDLSDAEMKEKGELKVQMDGYKATIASCNGELVAIQDATNNYAAAQQSLSGQTEDMANFLVEQYAIMDENGQRTWESLGIGLMTLDAKIQAHKDGTKVMSEEEIATSTRARDIIVENLKNKANEYGYSYDDMLLILSEQGVHLNDTEKQLFKDSMKNMSETEKEKQRVKRESMEFIQLINNSGLSALNEETKNMLASAVTLFGENGMKGGTELCKQLADSIDENKGDISWEALEIIKKIRGIYDSADLKLKTSLQKPTDKNVEIVQEQINKIPTSREVIYFLKAADNGYISSSPYNITKRAMGGFPETGELFVAREAGPELVGRINGKTAVANNDQIVTGISSGVYNAVRSAMQGNGGNGNMNIHATFVMDGEVVGKQVIKYHNGVVKRTGTTPLMI